MPPKLTLKRQSALSCEAPSQLLRILFTPQAVRQADSAPLQISRPHDAALRKVVTRGHHGHPALGHRHLHELVASHVHWLEQQSEIEQPAIEPSRHLVGYAREQIEGHERMRFGEGCGQVHNERSACQFAGADGDMPVQLGGTPSQLFFRECHQAYDLLGPALQQQTLIGQLHALFAAMKQLAT